ncbi:MAG TPA: Hsp70 family protein, partial [Cryptosporangiaceae bacterium]|nr:Hsp70 family protein [Cryptosporangiaceae bacterium]
MRVLGLDFGTSNTVAMLRTPDGRVRPLLFDGSPLLPSAVYLGTDGRMVVGRDAERNARVDPGRFEPNPKRRIDDGTVFLGDREMPVTQVFATVLGHVATEVRRQIGALPDELRMTHPARWAEKRRSILGEAAVAAGFPRAKLIAEPVAAASYFTASLGTAVPVGRSLAIYDLGGGTFDATVVRRTGAGFEVLAEGGLADVGGLDFDHAVIQHLGSVYRESHPETWQRLETPLDGADRRHRRMLWEDVRGAKEMLSRTSSADIHLPALEVDAHLTREELETLIRPYLERTVTCLTKTIAEANLQPRDLVGIFLVGGSSRIPLAAHLIHSQLGVAPTTLEQPETVVAEGSLRVGSIPDEVAPRSGPPSRPGGPPQGPPPPRVATPPPRQPVPPPRQPPSRPMSGPPVSPGPATRPGPQPPRP